MAQKNWKWNREGNRDTQKDRKCQIKREGKTGDRKTGKEKARGAHRGTEAQTCLMTRKKWDFSKCYHCQTL
jgi:hypothetical protein